MRRLVCAAALCCFAVTCSGCNRNNTTIMDTCFDVSPQQEWNRRIDWARQAKIRFRVSSPGRFGVLVTNDRARDAVARHDPKGFDKKDVYFITESKGPPIEGTLDVAQGSSTCFILENQTDRKVEMHLEIFDAEAEAKR